MAPADRPDRRPSRRIGVIGHGAVGAVVVDQLTRSGAVDLTAILTRHRLPDERWCSELGTLVSRSDLVVEAASQEALVEHGPTTVAAGRDLLVVSVGALVDDDLRRRLAAGPGRLLVTSGAIGGIDLLRAAHQGGGLDVVELRTTKPAAALVGDLATAGNEPPAAGRGPAVVFEGTARQAVARFPRTMNVAATLALATVGFDRTRVQVVADPAATQVEHRIRASGALGSWELHLRNASSSSNVRTSAVTPYAVVRGVLDLDAPVVIGA